jgi:hypothetical protein
MSGRILPPSNEAQGALLKIQALSQKVGKATGTKRTEILAEIEAQQKIINDYNEKKKNAKTTSERNKIRKSIKEQQDKLAIAEARGEDTSLIENRIQEFEDQLLPTDETLLKETDVFKPVVPGEKKVAGPVAVKPSTTKTPPPSGGADVKPAPDTKQLWVDYLTKTFRTLDNPAQKLQIDNLFAKAKAGKWTEATFMEALQGTDWWQQTLPSLRSFFIETNDPRNKSTFAQKMLNQTDYVQQQMEKLGIAIRDIDPVTGKVIDNTSMVQGIAMEAIQNGWSDAQLQEHLATKSEVIFTGGGLVGSYLDQLKSQALKYGVTLDKNQLSYMQRDLLNPADGKDAQYYLGSIKQQSIDANPWFAASLKEGRTLYDVTSTYRNQMATLLEVAPENITWNDLMNKVVNKEKNAANTFADFTKSVKQDPLWQYTRNAKETYSNMAVDLMKQFGFMG